MLGGFSISYGGRTIADTRSHSRKTWIFLEYLIAHRDRPIAQEELARVLWSREDIESTFNTLKTLLYRVRTLLDGLAINNVKQMVAYRRGTYTWAPRIKCVVDTEEFERLCEAAANTETDGDRRIKILMEAFSLYNGRFLPNHTHEPWVAALDERYHAMYVDSMYTLTDMLRERGRTGDGADVCKKVVAIDPFNEPMHIKLMQTLAQSGDVQQAVNHYDYITTLFFNGFGITPSKELTSIYKDLVRTTRARELNLNAIKEDLKETVEDGGCLFVEYEFFRSIYRLEARNEVRTGQVVYLALITVIDAEGDQPSLKSLRKAMDKLKSTISQSLRKGDVFTRFSVSQYLLLLPSATMEDGQMVLRRISKQFKKDNLRIPVQLAHSLQPVTPSDLETT
jgi:DNA-binding SARP family transcriptional activator